MSTDLPHDPELAERLEVVEAAARMEDRRSWPRRCLPMMRRELGEFGEVTFFEAGWLERDMGPVVLRAGADPLMYETFEDAARDGWRPD